jgi:DNA-binding NarL/FixJ family response regulator
MCVRVFLADDAEIMRKAIRTLLSKRQDIAVVGEAANIHETIQKTAELHPDLIILDVTMPEKDCIAPTKVRRLLNGAKILAITLGADDVKEELLQGVGAVKLLDKMDLYDQLIPAILELAPAGSRLNATPRAGQKAVASTISRADNPATVSERIRASAGIGFVTEELGLGIKCCEVALSSASARTWNSKIKNA